MWGTAPLHHLSRSAKHKALGRPLRQVIDDIDLWKRGELVQPLQVPESLRTEDFYIGDFALAKKVGESATQRGYPPMHSALPIAFMEKKQALPVICGVI